MTDGENLTGPAVPVHLRDLRAFVAVGEHLHFSRAAQALFTSQPALSKQIRALESLLRVELFVRDRRSVRLTAAGRTLLPGARATLQAWAAAHHQLTTAASDARSRLVVGITLGVERGLLPRIREHLGVLAPQARLDLYRVAWSDPSGGLRVREEFSIDAAFVWLPLSDPARYKWITVAREDRWAVMSSRHHLAGRDEVRFADIDQEPFIALPADAGAAREFWLGGDARGGRPAVIAGEVASSEELIESLRDRAAVCLIAEGNLDAFLRNDLTTARVTDLAPSELVLAWRRDDNRPSLHHLIAATQHAARQHRPRP